VAKKKTTRKRSRVVVRTRTAKQRSDAAKKGWRTRRLHQRGYVTAIVGGKRRFITTKDKRGRVTLLRKRRRRPPSIAEFSVNVSYRKGTRFQTNAISFQMSAIGPANASKDEVINVISDVLQSEGEDVKKGWKVRIVSWKDGQVPQEVPWGALAIISGEPATRFHVERDRSD
jgi:hypothetical protein